MAGSDNQGYHYNGGGKTVLPAPMIERLHGETEGLKKEAKILLSISNLEAAWNPVYTWVYRSSSAGISLKLFKQIFWSLSSQKERKLPKILSSSWALCWLRLCPFNWLVMNLFFTCFVLFSPLLSICRKWNYFGAKSFCEVPRILKLFRRNTSRNCRTRFSLEVSVSLTYGWFFHFPLACLTDCH